MSYATVITIVAHTDEGLRLIPGLRTLSSKLHRDALRQAFTPEGAHPGIAEAFDRATHSEEGFPIPMARLFAPMSPGVATSDIVHELPDLHTDITEMLETLEQLTTNRPMDDVTLFVSYE
ncbi:MAG: hypothetical protein DI630_00975 [Gordonia sp. (in: high G+C Gram-positive bacteria)]|nr:MAG: hypothetical protein DI630_00975 [Gordonia sp. (in: high G+C Gram-positive bacteria)]